MFHSLENLHTNPYHTVQRRESTTVIYTSQVLAFATFYTQSYEIKLSGVMFIKQLRISVEQF